MINFFFPFFIFYFYIYAIVSIQQVSQLTQDIKNIHNQIYMPYLTNYVLMCLWQLKSKQVNSQMPKVSNKTLEIPTIRSCVQHFKLTNEIQIIVSRSTKLLGITWTCIFKNLDKVCVSPIPPKLNYTLPSMCRDNGKIILGR
jgi:hypothetical protein